MADVVDRVRKLLARAGHEGTPEEEARSAGVMAARLIWAHELTVALPSKSNSTADLPPKHPIRTKWATGCIWCGHRIPVGELVMWAHRVGVAHIGRCAEEAFGSDGQQAREASSRGR